MSSSVINAVGATQDTVRMKTYFHTARSKYPSCWGRDPEPASFSQWQLWKFGSRFRENPLGTILIILSDFSIVVS